MARVVIGPEGLTANQVLRLAVKHLAHAREEIDEVLTGFLPFEPGSIDAAMLLLARASAWILLAQQLEQAEAA